MIKNFDTLNDFFNAANSDLHSGDIVVTGGYSAVNDGGAGEYYVISTENPNVAGLVISGKTFSKGSVQLELISDSGEVFVEQFGASSTASSAVNKAAIQAAIDSGARRINFRPTQYNVGDDILISHPVDIVGNGAKLVLETDSTSTQLFRVAYDATVGDNPPTGSIRDMKILGTHTITQVQETDSDTDEVKTVEKITNYNNGIKLVNVKNFTVSSVDFEYGNCSVYASNSNNINIENCNCNEVTKALYFSNASMVRLKNCKAKMISTGSQGVTIMGGTKNFIAEDVSITNANMALFVHDIPWLEEAKATDRILFKNLLVDKAATVGWFKNTYIPVCFSNAMFVDIKTNCFYLTKAENIRVNNSSVLLAAPADCAINAVPIHISGATKIKFTHTQFEFPWALQMTSYDYSNWGDIDIDFVDCTIQKTDITGLEKVVASTGFGEIGYAASTTDSFVESFDACEFRSYIQDSSIPDDGVYRFPMSLVSHNRVNSKVIFKNSRFVNENTCTIPYFKLDDNAKFDNIVVYNCFFENYDCSYEVETEKGNKDVYPVFGRMSNGVLILDADEHNIFAKCNMRSSEPVRNTGTTIDEMLEYI